MSSVVSEKTLCAATASYFSSRGYFVRRNYEVLGKLVDIVCIMPRLSDLKKRIKSTHFVPSGILYTLLGGKWRTTEDIASETGSSTLFVSSALEDIVKDGWVEKKEEDGKVFWKTKEYRIPSKDCVMAHCRYRKCMESLEGLSGLEGCYNKMYYVFPFPVDEEFIDLCSEKGVGILIFYERVGLFKELLPPEIKEVTNLKVYANLCEVVIKENLLYRSIDSI